jgi:hypothetical protein
MTFNWQDSCFLRLSEVFYLLFWLPGTKNVGDHERIDLNTDVVLLLLFFDLSRSLLRACEVRRSALDSHAAQYTTTRWEGMGGEEDLVL